MINGSIIKTFNELYFNYKPDNINPINAGSTRNEALTGRRPFSMQKYYLAAKK